MGADYGSELFPMMKWVSHCHEAVIHLFRGHPNLPKSEVLMAAPTPALSLSSGARPLQKKRIAETLSQLSLACQPSLTEGGNVDFVPGKFRSDKSGTTMRSICVVPVNKRAAVLHGDLQRYFFCFLVSITLREVPGNYGKPVRVK